MTAKKLDVKEALNATSSSFTTGIDPMADLHSLDQTRAGRQPDPIALVLLKAGGKKQ